MKKLLLAGLLIVFTGITFAEMPRIVNPPRPTKDFKFLLVFKNKPTTLQLSLVDYFYTDYFHVEYGEELYFGRHKKIVLDLPSQKCFFSVFGDTACVDLPPGHSFVIETYDSPELIQPEYLLEAKAPKKARSSVDLSAVEFQKAKVVFTK